MAFFLREIAAPRNCFPGDAVHRRSRPRPRPRFYSPIREHDEDELCALPNFIHPRQLTEASPELNFPPAPP